MSQDAPRVERFIWQDAGQWVYESVSGLDGEIRLASLDVVLPLAEVYERVTFPALDESGG